MRLIVDIDEKDRIRIGNLHFVPEELRFEIGRAIMKGTPLLDPEKLMELAHNTIKDIAESEGEI